MTRSATLSLGSKIKAIRKHKNLTQQNLADGLGCGVGTINRIENNHIEHNSQRLGLLKKLLDVEGAPLLESELAIYKERLQIWRNLIKDRRLEEARKMCAELAVIVKLPFEQDLNMLYNMFEVKLLLSEGDVGLAVERLDIPKESLSLVSDSGLYHYYYNKGSLCLHNRKYKEALTFYLKADALCTEGFEREVSLDYNIAGCYSELGMPYNAIMILERIYSQLNSREINTLYLFTISSLASNYINIKKTKEARTLLDKYLFNSQSIGNPLHIGIALHNFGCLDLWNDKPKTALGYFNRAFEYFNDKNWFYLENAYCKIRCLIELGELKQSEILLAESMSFVSSDNYYVILFESLHHIVNIKTKIPVDT